MEDNEGLGGQQYVELTPLRPQRRAVTEERLGEDDVVIAGSAESPRSGLPALVTHPASPVGDASAAYSGPHQQRVEDYSYIWGTGIAVEVFRDEFRGYLESFDLSTVAGPSLADGNGELAARRRGSASVSGSSGPSHEQYYYLREMLRMHLQGRSTLELNFTWLQQLAPRLYVQAIHHPTECLQIMSAVAEEMYRDVLAHRHGVVVPDDLLITVAAKRLPVLHTLKQLSPQHIEQLLSVKGMVIRVSKIIPEIRVACFQCWSCNYQERSVSGDKGRIFEPTRCSHCGKSYSFRLQHNLSLYEDKQLIKVQESPEHVADGETPISIGVVVYGSMVDAVVPGDRLVVTGIFRSTPIRLNANTRIIKSIFSTHMDAVHMELVRATRTTESGANNRGTAADAAAPTLATTRTLEAERPRSAMMETARLDLFHTLAHRRDIYDILLRSFARPIWGHDDVKRGILSQLFGGTAKTFVFSDRGGGAEGADPQTVERGGDRPASANSAVFRSEMHLLLCGDPGVAKSQLLAQVHEIAPRGVYTSGKGSSSVGLTAFVVHDTDTGELVLEPGALVLSDRGICCIDEFDKMSEATRSVLHEVMEQQTLSIAKAGIIAQLNARTSILAAANPKESQWNPQINVVENLQIEPTLLSRFDLIFLLLDRHDPTEDRRLASHVLSLYMDTSNGQRNRHAADVGRNSSDDDDEGGGESRRTRHDAHNDAQLPPTTAAPPGPSKSTIDPITGASVAIHAELEGEIFLQGPQNAAYMPPAILSEYIALARETVMPRLTEASHKQLALCYVELRKARGSSRTVSATLRQLESMIRLSEARAKMRYSSTVSVEDVLEAKRIISAALKESATDPTTGLISLDMFHAADPTKNTPEGNMRRLEEVIERRYLASGRSSASVAELRLAFSEHPSSMGRAMPPAQFLELLALLAGGDVVQSFTSTTVTFAQRSSGGAAGGAVERNAV